MLVYLGYRTRHSVHAHKRWMLFASVMIIPQAFVRIGKFEFFQIGTDPGISGSIYAVAGPVLILLSLVTYDLYSSRSVHRATIRSLVWYISLLISSMIIMRSGIGVSILDVIRDKW